MRKKTLKNDSGFTLIELLIVLTILVALTLLGTYKYFNIVEENKQKIDITNARMLAEAVDVADATGKIVLSEGNNEISYDKLSGILDKELAPTSKKYSGGDADAKFTITVVKTGDIFTTTIAAADQTLYPAVE